MSENFKLVPVDELTGKALDYAVAKLEGAVYPSPTATWSDVKDLPLPFSLWCTAFDEDGRHVAEKVEVSEVSVRCTRLQEVYADIAAVGPFSGSFVDSLGSYYTTQQDADNEIALRARGDLRFPKRYSTDWSLAGPILDREVGVLEKRKGYWYAWRARRADGYVTADFKIVPDSKEAWVYGPTLLIAALRCYVAAKFGAEVEVPERLLKP